MQVALMTTFRRTRGLFAKTARGRWQAGTTKWSSGRYGSANATSPRFHPSGTFL